MEASAGLVAGSHNRTELAVIRRDGGGGGGVGVRMAAEAKAACQICGDDVGEGPDGEPFVACNECAFPVCRNCYDYERREGSQACPQCKTRFKRLKGELFLRRHCSLCSLLLLRSDNVDTAGCPRVAGDEEEDGVDDLEGEFGLDGREDDPQYIAESMLRANMSYGRGGDLQPFQPIPNVPLLTNGQMVRTTTTTTSSSSSSSDSALNCSEIERNSVFPGAPQVDDIPPEQHALVPSYMGGGGGGGKRIHPLPFADPSVPGG